MLILAKVEGKVKRKLCCTQPGTRHSDALGPMMMAETSGRFFITFFSKFQEVLYAYDFMESESVLAARVFVILLFLHSS